MCVTSFVCSSSTVATFLIIVPLSKSFTVTLNSKFLLSPACNSTSIPCCKLSCVNSGLSSAPTFMLPLTNVVSVGTVSFTFTVVGAVPVLLSNPIMYVISSPFSTFSPLAGSEDLLISTFGFLTSVVTSSVGFPSTVAVFDISFLNVSPANSFTVTSNVTSLLVYGCTFTVIPLLKFPSSSVISLPSIFTLFGTSVVPSGILSITVTSFA